MHWMPFNGTWISSQTKPIWEVHEHTSSPDFIEAQWQFEPLVISINSKTSNVWKIWVFHFPQCILILVNKLLEKKAWRKIYVVGTSGKSSLKVPSLPAFNKGSANWLGTGKLCDAGTLQGDYLSQLLATRLRVFWVFFSLILIKQYSSGLPKYFIARDFKSIVTAKYLWRPSLNWLLVHPCCFLSECPLCVYGLVLPGGLCYAQISPSPLKSGSLSHTWSHGMRPCDHTWSAGNPHFKVPGKLFAAVHS